MIFLNLSSLTNQLTKFIYLPIPCHVKHIYKLWLFQQNNIQFFCKPQPIQKSAHWLKHVILRYGVKLTITCTNNDGMRNCLTVKPSTLNFVSACASNVASPIKPVLSYPLPCPQYWMNSKGVAYPHADRYDRLKPVLWSVC